MNKLRKILPAVLLTVVLAVQFLVPARAQEPALMTWWGTLYPGFCFGTSEIISDTENKCESSKEHKVKISFWLAKAFDW